MGQLTLDEVYKESEKAAAEKWKLSDREWEIVRRLG